MKRLLSLALLLPCLAWAETVVTHLPVNQYLTEQLLQETEHNVEYLPPKRYNLSRLENWFASKAKPEQIEQWAKADALVHLNSLWPKDPLYPLLRQYNVRIIAIDSADPQHPKATKVAVRSNKNGSISPFVWLNPNNLKTMSTIISRDLSALYPAHAVTISRNQQALLKAIAKMEQRNQDWLFDNEVEEVIVVGDKLADFVYGYNLFAVGHFSASIDQWQAQQWQQLAQLHDEGVTLLVAKQPTKDAAAKLEQMGIKLLLIDTVEKMGKGTDLLRWQLKS
ncbi:metal ABC transporter solute-binding protein, Zn/Mn family [Ferrimonas lipolytica]|uniref:Zinc ABC transporter solute-binding protein n=1 Tax=Ferrimonas lipolytica TaxID=2724191 RepID=A0A6H1UDF7_9GAMM|nr:zinc ABC transporter substrate-binding protein [Ferrimonas lipolytica]QIZ77074.1 zinc ABC transporter solute-binding protein [Ferrimonas lipolytica]